MATPKETHPTIKVFSLYLCALLAVPALPIPAGAKTAEKTLYECTAVTFTHPDLKKPVRLYVKKVPNGKGGYEIAYGRQTHSGSHARGNPGEHLFTDRECITQSRTHLYKKAGVVGLHHAGVDKPFSEYTWTEGKSRVFPERVTTIIEKEVIVEKRVEVPVEVPGTGSAGAVKEQEKKLKGADTLVDPNDPVGAIVKKLLAGDTLDSDLVVQFGEFLWKEPYGFIDDKYRKLSPKVPDPVADYIKKWAILDRIKPARAGGPGSENAKKWAQSVIEIASMYYILKVKPTFEETLVDCLGRYSMKKETNDTCNKGDEKFPSNFMEFDFDMGWLSSFLVEATESSKKILDADNVPKKKPEGAADRHDEAGSVVGGNMGAANPGLNLPTSTPAFEEAYLFGKYGDKNVMFIDGRVLALVVRSKRTFVKSSDGEIETKIVPYVGLYDITSPENIYGARIKVNDYATTPIKLWSGGKSYVFTLSPMTNGSHDTLITVKTSDGAEAQFPPGIKMPTLNDLYVMRAEKALGSGYVADLGGKEYRVTAESSRTADHFLWSEEKLDEIRAKLDQVKRGEINGHFIVPSGIASVTQKAGGVVSPIAKQVPTGINVDGKWYDLRRAPNGVWEPVVAEGPPPETPVPTKDDKGGKSGTGGVTVDSKGTVPWPSFNGMSREHSNVAAINKKLAPLGYNVYVTPKGNGKFDYTMVKKSAMGENAGFGADTNFTFELIHDMLVAKDEKGIRYIDVGRGFKATKDSKGNPAWLVQDSGMLTKKKAGLHVFGGDGIEAFKEALPHMGFSESERKAAVEAANAAINELKGKEYRYVIHKKGGMKGAWLEVGGQKMMGLWPHKTILKPRTNNPLLDVGVVRNGIILDREQMEAGQFKKFPKDMPALKVGKEAAKTVSVEDVGDKSDSAMARLYKAVLGEKSVWYLEFVIKTANGDMYSSNRIKVFENPAGKLGGDAPRTAFPGEGKVHIRGIDIGKVSKELKLSETWTKQMGRDWTIRIVEDSQGLLKDRGALAVYDTPQAGKGKFENLIGIIAYWGMDIVKAKDLAGAKGA